MRFPFILGFVLACGVPGCAALRTVVPVLTQVAGDLADAQAILDAIEAAERIFFLGNPDVDHQQAVEAALANCRMGLDAAVRSLRGVDEVSNEKLDDAYRDFRSAWDDLQRVLRATNILGSDHRMKTSRGPVGFPTPLMVRQ
jgi:uncharacterized protein YbjT (DUF2867 family)